MRGIDMRRRCKKQFCKDRVYREDQRIYTRAEGVGVNGHGKPHHLFLSVQLDIQIQADNSGIAQWLEKASGTGVPGISSSL
jgi:hypothetical protein